MQQKRYNTVASLMDAGTKMSAGAATYSAALGLTVGTKPLIDAEVNALDTANNALLDGKSDLRTQKTVLNDKRKAGIDMAFACRNILSNTLGRSYSSQWDGTGFNGSLKIPTTVAKVEQTLRALKTYFTGHASLEVPNVATAALIDAALTALTNAKEAVTVQRGVVRGLVTARKQKEKAIRKRVRGVVEELDRVIGPIDARWDSFGLNQPGIKQAPPTPAAMTVVSTEDAKVGLKWGKTARAEYYNIWAKVVGVDEAFVKVGTRTDLDFTIAGLTVGAQVEIAHSAVNNGGESGLSEAVKVTVV